MKQTSKALKLTETAVMIALASILSLIAVIKMPFGGSVSAFSMLPIAIIAFRHKLLRGLLAGFAHSLIQLMMGMENLSYATSGAAAAAIIMLDYVVAFTGLGLSGIFRGKFKSDGTAIALGTLLACVLRYICHVISGCTVWAGVSIPTGDGLIFSLGYNAAYMVPETLLTVIAAYFAAEVFTLKTPEIKRVRLKTKAAVRLYTAIPAAVAVLVVFLMLFGMMQTEEGYDITAMGNAGAAEWIIIAVVSVLGVTAAFIINRVFSKKLSPAVKEA